MADEWVPHLLDNITVAAGATTTASIGPAWAGDIAIDLAIAGTAGTVDITVEASPDGNTWYPLPVRDLTTSGGDYVTTKSLDSNVSQFLLRIDAGVLHPHLRLSIENGRDAAVTVSAWAVLQSP